MVMQGHCAGDAFGDKSKISTGHGPCRKADCDELTARERPCACVHPSWLGNDDDCLLVLCATGDTNESDYNVLITTYSLRKLM
jgi:hypothetical protein